MNAYGKVDIVGRGIMKVIRDGVRGLQSGSKHFGTLVKVWAKSREFTVHASIVI